MALPCVAPQRDWFGKGTTVQREMRIPVAVQVERRQPANRWAEAVHVPVGIANGAMDLPDWTLLREADGTARFHATNAEIVLHRKDTEGLIETVAEEKPVVFVVMRPVETAPGVAVHLVTASTHEAQDHTDAGEDAVERVPMPPEIAELIEAFVAAHHVDEPFYKRKRKRDRVEEHKFGKEPIFTSSVRPPESGKA